MGYLPSAQVPAHEVMRGLQANTHTHTHTQAHIHTHTHARTHTHTGIQVGTLTRTHAHLATITTQDQLSWYSSYTWCHHVHTMCKCQCAGLRVAAKSWRKRLWMCYSFVTKMCRLLCHCWVQFYRVLLPWQWQYTAMLHSIPHS